jgi:hypothetical protein
MSTSNTRSDSHIATPDLEAASERIREANDRLLAAGRKMTGAYLDGVERYVAGVTKAERKFGEQSQFEVFGQMLNAHAGFTEDVVKAGVTATRELISA